MSSSHEQPRSSADIPLDHAPHTPDVPARDASVVGAAPDALPAASSLAAHPLVTGSQASSPPVEPRATVGASVEPPRGTDAPATDAQMAEAEVGEAHAGTAMRLEALGLLAGGVAHDFNNILAVIRANVELARGALDSRTPDVPVALSDLGEVERAVERASELVRQLLAFGRRQRLALEPLDLNIVMRETLALVRVLVGDAVQIVLRPAPDVPRVRADRPQIEQVLVSLVLNGRDAIAEHPDRTGTLTVATRTSDVTAAEAARLGLARAGRYACLQVRDTGVGMDAATRARIFEPFFTTKAVDRGAGLGLAATWGIVRQSLGAIDVVSAPGVGSTFTVYLPATEAGVGDTPAQPTAAAPAESDPTRAVRAAPLAAPFFDAPVAVVAPRRDDLADSHGPGTGITVLLAEDDPAVRRATSRILRGAGYQVLEAGDGRSALALWRARAAEIDLLLADLRMPHLRGDALARSVRADNPGLPVVLMTGFSEDPAFASAHAPGGFDGAERSAPVADGPLLDAPVLAKPFGAAELLSQVAATTAGTRATR